MARILIVDGTEYMRRVMRMQLDELGHEVVAEAASAVEAVQRYRECRPDLTTMDISVDEEAGVQALRAIRRIDPAARIVMIGTLDRKEAAMDAVCVDGAVDYLIKPFTLEQLRRTIERALAADL